MLTPIRRFFSPDPEVPVPGAPPRKKRTIPKADGDLATLATKAAEKWSVNEEFYRLVWTTREEFATAAGNFTGKLQQRRDTGALRPGYTYTLNELQGKMDEGLTEIKVAIQGKFKKAGAAAQYPRYGLIHRGGEWMFPTDRDDVKTSLTSIIAAIAADGFGAHEYGTAYWTDIKGRYNAAFDAAKNTDGSVSEQVGDKNAVKEYLVKVLGALYHLIQANHPDDYEQAARDWGFQKEDY